MTRRFEDELKDLDAAIGATSEATDEFGVQLMRESLVRRRELLVEEADGVLELALRGDVPQVTGAEVPLVAGVLGSLQESLASIAQVLSGEPTSRGLIPGAIKDMVALRIAWAAPGSLQLKLVPVHPASEEPEPEATLFDTAESDEEEEEPTLLDQSMDRLIGLLSDSDEEEQEQLLQGIADVGPRATLHLQHLSKTLGEAGANASLTWRSARSQRSTRFTRSAAQRLAVTLEEVQEESREVVYTGRLVGGSLVHRSFELELEDGSLVAGKVSDDALAQMVDMPLGQDCTAYIEIREATLPSGEMREAHTLTRLGE